MKKSILAVLVAAVALSLMGFAWVSAPPGCTQIGTAINGDLIFECIPVTATAVSSATASPAATRTATPAPTNTPAPSTTPTGSPSATSLPSATPSPQLAAVDPAILGTCTAAVHDRYAVTGPDGKLYRTWHPPVVLTDPTNPGAGTCAFAHEHGDDPTKSLANSSLPAFGYIGGLVGDAEAHSGFKIYVTNAGVVNIDGGVAQNSTRIVFHQGTGGVKRFDTRYHSLMFDLVAPDGHYAHVQGMADTSGVGSICADPRPGKVVVETSGCAITSLYEIWAIALNVGDHLTVNAASGVFDPITVLDSNSLPGQRPLIYSVNAFPQYGAQFGCSREDYAGPVYWYNQNGPTTFTTDAYGGPGTLLTQQVSANSDLGIRMSSIDFYQMKNASNSCVAGIGVGN